MVEAVFGIDVGKHKLHVSLLFPGKKPKPKAIANTPEGHQTLLKWLQQQDANQVHVCLEATSTYGEAVTEVLHEAGHRVIIVNPARIGGFAKSELSRTKTGKVYAALISRFCAAICPSLWTEVPPFQEQEYYS